MAQNDLSRQMIAAGEQLADELDTLGLAPELVAWLYDPELEEWRLLIATLAVDTIGRSKLYSGLLDLFDAGAFGDALNVDDVHFVASWERTYERLRAFAEPSATADAHVYRCAPTPCETQAERRGRLFVKRARQAARRAA